jgi:hypothetical protein
MFREIFIYSFIHSIGMWRMRQFFAVLRYFFLSSMLYTFSCYPSSPTILPSYLITSCHLFLGPPLNLVYMYMSQPGLISYYLGHRTALYVTSHRGLCPLLICISCVNVILHTRYVSIYVEAGCMRGIGTKKTKTIRCGACYYSIVLNTHRVTSMADTDIDAVRKQKKAEYDKKYRLKRKLLQRHLIHKSSYLSGEIKKSTMK